MIEEQPQASEVERGVSSVDRGPEDAPSGSGGGAIPRLGQRRLGKLGGADGAFTSDLSIADFALCDRLGLKPLSQVMGTSVYQIGYEGARWGFEAEMTELTTISEAWNEARDLALGRVAQEASSVGASAVVGVNVASSTANWAEVSGYGSIEYLVTGTAVRRQGQDPRGGPVLTELSVADYAKLLAAGIEPLGIVAWTAVFFVSSIYMAAERPLFGGTYYQSYEYREVTECFYGARERVMSEIGRQAQGLGATGVVGVRIGHTIHSGSLRMMGGAGLTQSGSERPGLIASFSAIGTAVQVEAEGTVQAPMTAIEMTS